MMNELVAEIQQSCCSTSGCCDKTSGNNSIGRRHFTGTAGLTAAALMAGSADLMAGPFNAGDFESVIPADKKLSKEWIAGLYARGEALSATGDELAKVGMPMRPARSLFSFMPTRLSFRSTEMIPVTRSS